MKVNTEEYEGYQIDVVQQDVAWRWNVYATRMNIARHVPSDAKQYESAEQALIAARAAVDEVLGRAI